MSLHAYRCNLACCVVVSNSSSRASARKCSLMVRRRKKDVLTQLPAKHRRTVVVKVSDADATKLRELRHNLEVADRDSSGEQSWDSMMALGEMWRAAGLAKLNVRAVSVLNYRFLFFCAHNIMSPDARR